MPFADLNITDAEEPEVVDPDEYEVKVTDAQLEESKKGDPMVHLTLDILNDKKGDPVGHTRNIHEYMVFPNSEDDEDARNFKKLQIRRACEALGVPYDEQGFNVDDFFGQTAWAMLGKDESDEYGESNEINRWVQSSI